MLPALYELAAEYRSAADQLANLELDEQTIADTLEGLSGDLEQKCSNVAFVIRNIESLAEQSKQAEQQMAARREAIEKRAKRIREYLLRNMLDCKIPSIESPWFAIAVKNNPGKVVIDDERAIPSEYMRQPEPPPAEPDKNAIKQAIKAGKEVAGAHIEHTQRVEIK